MVLLHLNVSRTRLVPSLLLSFIGKHSYSTHKARAPSLLHSHQLDVKARDAFQRSADVGPFRLGPAVQVDEIEKVRKWKDLNATDKVFRTTARTTNLVVILFGAGFSAMLIYALATELFAPSSPTVLYGEACDKVRASPEVAKHLRGSLRFHTNPPLLGRPQHRNRSVSHYLSVDSKGKEHLLINFFVTCDPTSQSRDEDLPLSQRTIIWWRTIVDKVQTSSYEDIASTVRTKWRHVLEYSASIFHLLTNQRATHSSHDRPPTPEMGSIKPEPPSHWAITGMFSNLRGNSRSVRNETASDATHWTEGEVHGDLVRNSRGEFQWRYLLLDIPTSRVRTPVRIFVERDRDVRDNEIVILQS